VKLRLLLATALLISLSCMAGVSPRVRSIDVVYIGSMWEDINRDNPFSARVTDQDVIKIAHTLTEPPYMEYFLQQTGLHELMSGLGFDFVIGDTLVYGDDYFPISKSMGYAIKNFGGIRFAMICSAEDSLTMEDQVRLSLLRERSDILWVIDTPLLNMPPSIIKFKIDQRTLSDTSVSMINAQDDTGRVRLIRDFRRRIDRELNTEIRLGGRIADHVLSSVAQKEELDGIIYPEELFLRNEETDMMSLRTLMESVSFELKFRKAEMEREQITEFCKSTGCLTWGNIKQTNTVLVPDEKAGNHMFDYYYGRKKNED